MKFRYKNYGSQILRPVIPITIFANDQSLTYEVLVDSGADICLFHTTVAEILDIKLSSGKVSSISGVTGNEEPVYIHNLTIAAGDHFLKSAVGFLQNIGGEGYGIVGQKGFFEEFIIKFNLSKEEIELKPGK